MRISKTLLASLAVLLCLACALGLAQSITGDLTGTVYDASGATVPNATVVAKNDATGVEATTVSTSTGEYHLNNLPPGSYTVTVTASGFLKSQIKGLTVELSKTTTANFRIEVGTNVQTIEVTDAAATLDTTTAQVQNTFQDKLMMDLPTASSGSGVLNLSLLNAGVGTSGAVGLGTGPSVGGQRPRNNNFTIEGIDNNSGSVTGPLVSLPNDAVAEFTVQQNQISPEFGHSSGGQFNQVIKSGTNQLHGTAYEYLENRNLNAADNLSAVDGTPLHPRFDDNRFGFTAGGPIKKNKMFFFAGYEYEPTGGTASAGLLYAPTSNGWNTLSAIPGISANNLAQLKKYLGTAGSAVPAASVGGYPLVGAGNESLGWSAAQQAAAKSIELGQLSITAPSYTNNERAVAAFDYNISDKDSLRARVALNRSGFIDTAASLPTFFETVPSNNYLVTFSEFHNFSPNVVNEFRAGFNRYSNDYSAGNFSWPGLDQFPNVEIFELNAQIGPDPNAPQFGFQNQYQLTDNVSITKGNHSFRVGFDGYKQISPQSFTQRARGDYEWSYLSDYLFDYNPDYLAQRSLGNVTYYGDRVFTGFYGNDTWKVKPNLSINIGLRYEYTTVPYSERLQTVNAISNVPGLITFSQPQPQKDAFMPRVGIAYSPGKTGNTSIRAGFGESYDVLFDNFGLLTLPPQFVTTVDLTGLDQGSFLANGGIKPSTSTSGLDQADARAGTGGYTPNQTRPKSLQWNIGVQHVFFKDYTFETRYLGTRGINLPVQIQLNRQPVVNASDALPVFFSAPSQATLNSLSNTLANVTSLYNAGGNVVPAYLNAGFTGIITSYQPWGNSTYQGWANQLTRRFSNGLQFIGAYTFSHNIDDSTAEVFSTYTTPRRAQNGLNMRPERSSSALDHRNRLTFETVYTLPFFKHSHSWAMKNLVGNWEIAPIYTYQTGTLVTVQSGIDSNLNGDSAGDRTIVNPSGNPAIGSGTTALTNSAGQTVGFLVSNPAAMYVTAPKGTIATGGRNTEHVNPIDDIDLTLQKQINVTERYHLQFAGRFFNVMNHPQYTAGNLSDVAPVGFTGTAQHNFLIPNTSLFMQPSQVFSSNPRSAQISVKLIF